MVAQGQEEWLCDVSLEYKMAFQRSYEVDWLIILTNTFRMNTN